MTDNSGSQHDAVVIERTFDAPVDLIWKMWTDAENFKAWHGAVAGCPRTRARDSVSASQ